MRGSRCALVRGLGRDTSKGKTSSADAILERARSGKRWVKNYSCHREEGTVPANDPLFASALVRHNIYAALSMPHAVR